MTIEHLMPILNRGGKFLLLTAGWVSLAAPVALAQTTVLPATVPAQTANQTAKPITFEIVSIHQGKFGDYGGNGFTADGIDFRGLTPLALIMNAYNLSSTDIPRISGLPDWGKTEFYNIDAKVADSDVAAWGKVKRLRAPIPAFQALLEDRFKLKAHFETRDTASYALVVAKSGLKLKESKPGDTYPKGDEWPNGKPVLGISTGFVAPHDHLTGQAATMASLAAYLGSVLDRPVVDETGLKGKYDFTMPFSRKESIDAGPDDSSSSEPSVFTALPEYLGLRLEKTKSPIQFLVIDHIEKPTAN